MPSLQSHLSCNNPACEDAQEKLLGFDEVYEQIVMGSPESLFDLPPESFWVPKGSEQDWVHQNANMQRRTSMKLQSLQDGFSGDSKSQSHRSFSAVNKSSSSSLLALPKPRNPKAAASTRLLFRSMSEPGGGGEMRVAEPGSPKVSCTGRVRSTKKKKGGGGRRTGFWRRLGLGLRNRFGTDRVARSERSGESHLISGTKCIAARSLSPFGSRRGMPLPIGPPCQKPLVLHRKSKNQPDTSMATLSQPPRLHRGCIDPRGLGSPSPRLPGRSV
nr:calcium/calmodulin protein kinase 1 [Ipomoea batatas]